MNLGNKSSNWSNCFMTNIQTKTCKRGLKKYETWGMGLSIEEVPKQFVVEGGAKFEREPKTHLHTILFVQNH